MAVLGFSQTCRNSHSVRTVDHKLCDDENGLLGDHSVQAHQSFMLQLLHEVGLLEKGLGFHRAFFQGLDRNLLLILVEAYTHGWTVNWRYDSVGFFVLWVSVSILPIHTSPNWPAPSFLSILNVCLGISHSSCAQGSWGALTLQGAYSFRHRPSGVPALKWFWWCHSVVFMLLTHMNSLNGWIGDACYFPRN